MNILLPHDGDSDIDQGLERLLPSDAKAAYTRSQPLGRFGHVRDIADATVYLFSDAGSYVTGQTLVGKWPQRLIGASCWQNLTLR